MLRMEYPEVQATNGDIHAAIRCLQTLGWEKIGSGNFGYAFAKGDRVVKVGHVNADNYLNYVRMVGLRSNNPHLPYIYSVQVYDMDPDTHNSRPFYVVEMEKLSNAPKSSDAYWRKLLGAPNPTVLNQNTIEYVKPKTGAMKELKKILTHLYNCYSAGYDVGRCFEGHVQNILWRGETAVFIDPVV